VTGIQRRRAQLQAQQRKRIGLRRRMLAFFEANPDEDITIEQLAVKFDAKPSSVRTELHRLKGEGAVGWALVWRARPAGEEGLEDRLRRERLEQERAEREGRAEAEPEDQADLFAES
jgi:hypothetical protein